MHRRQAFTNFFRQLPLIYIAARHEAVYARPADELVVHRCVVRERVAPSGLRAEILLSSAAHVHGSLHAYFMHTALQECSLDRCTVHCCMYARCMHGPRCAGCSCSAAQSRAERCRATHHAESCRCHSPPWLSSQLARSSMRRACLCAHAQKEGTGRGAACVRASCIALRASFRITCDGLRGGPLMQAV